MNNYYPSSIRLMATRIGWEHTLQLLRAFPRRKNLYIPCLPLPDDHPLRQVLPEEIIHELQKHYKRRLIHFPRCSSIRKKERNDNILAEYKGGDAIIDIAVRYDLGYDMVLKILNERGEHVHTRNKSRGS